jgi:hypothetical protein
VYLLSILMSLAILTLALWTIVSAILTHRQRIFLILSGGDIHQTRGFVVRFKHPAAVIIPFPQGSERVPLALAA